MCRSSSSRAPCRGSLWSGALLLAVLPALAACGSHRGGETQAAADRRSAVLYSPNGEPLSGGPLGNPSCPEAVSGWFGRVDANHDGAIDRDEFLADSRRQFAAMDLDKDGIITPSELAQYRLPFLAGGTGPAQATAGAPSAGAGSNRERGGSSGSDGAIPRDRPDPVMLADVSLRNRVTLSDFLAYEERNFVDLGASRDGRLGKAATLRICGPADGS